MQLNKVILRLTKFLSRYGRYYFLGSLLLAISCLPVWQSQEEVSAELVSQYNPYEQQFIEALEDTLQYLIDDSRVPGVGIAVVKDSTPLLVKGYGIRSVKQPDSVDIHTVFRLASVSKGFASGLAATLVRDTLLHWNDPVVQYLPSFALVSPEQTQAVTVKHVLSHTTGLPYHAYTNLVEANKERDDMIALLSEIDLIGEAGRWYSYQNVAYCIIEPVAEVAAIETAKVESFQTLMENRIFKPLQMNDASVWYNDMMEVDNKAVPHLPSRRGWYTTPISKNYYNVPSAGGVNASPLDMAQWLMALLGNRPDVLPTEVLDSLFSPQIKTPIENRYFSRWKQLEGAYYGLGWRIVHQAGDTIAFHGGYANGYRTAIALDRNKKIGICILANGSSSLVSRVVPIFLDLYRKYEDDIKAWEVQVNEEVAD